MNLDGRLRRGRVKPDSETEEMMQSIPVEMIIDQLWRHEEENPEQNIFAIVDAARHASIYRKLGDFGSEYLCLYQGIIPTELAQVAPYIVQLQPDAYVTEWLIKNGWGNSWGILAVSTEDLFEAAVHFRRFVQVKDEDGNMLYFRYYDPRIFRVYLPTCIRPELRYVFGKTSSFLMEDENGSQMIRYSLIGSKLNRQVFPLLMRQE